MSSTHYSAIPALVDHVRHDQANTTNRHNPENQPPNPFPNPANLDNLANMAGEKPAARLTDMHTCPESTGPVPHVGGPIMLGSPNVFIGGLPAARVTDPVTCVGPPDTIVMGAPTVLINGLPAARMGDQTAHGGVIVGGCPTVLIGMGGAAEPTPPYDPPIQPVYPVEAALAIAAAIATGGASAAIKQGLSALARQLIPNETRISRSDGQTGVSGRRGNQLENPKYQRSRNPPVTINGREFSGHALDQMQNRGIPPSAVENAIKPGNLFSTNEAKGTYGYFDKSNDLRVITNIQSGRVVTVIPGSP